MYLETEHLTKHFGGVAALDDVSLEFPAGQVTAIVGPNGAGKTTLFNTMAGFLNPDSGSVRIVDHDHAGSSPVELTGREPFEVARQGLGVLFQDIRVFRSLSALDNVAVGARDQLGEGAFPAVFRRGVSERQDRRNRELARTRLEFVGLADKAHTWAGNLSYGQQKLVALARLLASDARILLLDEPTSGLHTDMCQRLLGLIEKLAIHDGKAIIMVEHNLNAVRRAAEWVYLMARGRVEVFGEPREVLADRFLRSLLPRF